MQNKSKTGGVKRRYSAHRYREEGAIVKDWGGRLPIALIYPNSYYLGMSNLGVQALYGLLNNNPKIVAERVFLDTTEKNAPAAIESGRPLTDFAVLAFSISYELDYFNVIQILKAADIPLLATERDSSPSAGDCRGTLRYRQSYASSAFLRCILHRRRRTDSAIIITSTN